MQGLKLEGLMRRATRDGSRASGMHVDQWSTRLERDGRLWSALGDVLVPQETVEVVAYGEAGSAVIGTPWRALVFKRGLKAGTPFGWRLKSFEYESVVAVNLRRLRQGGVLAIHAPLKVGSCAVYWVDERDDAWKARNALMLQEPLDQYEPVVDRLRTLAAAHQELHGRATPQPVRAVVSHLTASAPPAANARADPAAPHPVCSNCGADLQIGWRSCPGCGASFERPAGQWHWLQTERDAS